MIYDGISNVGMSCVRVVQSTLGFSKGKTFYIFE